ncbi:YhbY family RNA-binding protein [Anaerofustis stercorihominis]|uniref:RNA-binding protein, YhbY family n=1 Tax=Anaerofustis stercorihominis DSM 17244 TaxID=445971 RepID=B1C9S9_9FIRM|nr:YhbY family RNA-binding protein [Anaerofustis stercorihominis]EDS72145.1 putative RNA-binding protein, YhbY family [Anaerofustis stercorihominis DSM 17244]MCQ4795797.1 YhbY family RNA-binding protein [Anaerofustis stercorihominis]
MNSKERSLLKKEASKMQPIIHIGKDGMSDNIVTQADDALKVRELVKGKIQQNSLEDVRESAEYLAEKTNSEVVITIGSTFVLYRRNPDKNKYNI